MSAALDNPRLLSLAAGFTDNETLPVESVTAAAEALRVRESSPEHLQYGAPQGRRRLRELLSARTAHQDALPSGGIVPARTMVGNGSQQLLYLAAQVLCDPGDIVLVERPTYFVFLEMLAGLGVRPVSLPAKDAGSYDLEGIRALLRTMSRNGEAARVKAVYLLTYFANPSGISRPADEKSALAELLIEHGLIVPVIEDAAYRELWFEEPWPARSVFALESWERFQRLYLGTLTKPFAAGLKIGFAHASDADLLDRMAWLKGHHDFGSANFNQAILEHVIESGDFEAHLELLRPAYARKMKHLDRALTLAGLRKLGWEWDQPAGGLYLWVRGPEGIDTSGEGAFWNSCLEEEVIYVPGDLCIGERDDRRYVRLSFGVLDPAALEEGARRFARAASRFFAGTASTR
ncbi:MAG: PLP-dependent aminotransferase family protein [Opitutaceae bacterium]